jgi:4,5-dihydroxyphthalate decarboxylase
MTMAIPASRPVTLRTNLADSALSRALKSGAITSELVRFDFCGPQQAHEGFKPMVRGGKFDAGELAIVTYLQALTYGKPLSLLPAVVMARPQHHCIVYHTSRGRLSPRDIEGRRIGIRSYTQTTGVWVRGILQHEYGVDPGRVTWVCTDDSHLAEFRDPANVERAPAGSRVEQLLLEGAIDGAILGADLPDEPRIAHLITEPLQAAREWSRKHGLVPVNHLFAVDRALAHARPDLVREIYRLLAASKQAGVPSVDGADPLPFGIPANRRALEMIITYSFEQGIIPRRFEVDELFDDATRSLCQ